MPEPVRSLHLCAGQHEFGGRVHTEAPTSRLARLLARCLGTPMDAGSGVIRFELDANPGREVWTRHFAAGTMRSRLGRKGQDLTERLGPVRLTFTLQASVGKLVMRLKGLHFLGVPCPAWARPQITAEETGEAGRLFFKVRASLPRIGLVAAYSGYLDLMPAAP